MQISIGERIKAIRKERGLQQKELAGMIGISSARLSNFECGKNRVDVELLGDIASALKVPVGEILGIKKFDGVLSEDEIFVLERMRKNNKLREVIYSLVEMNGDE